LASTKLGYDAAATPTEDQQRSLAVFGRFVRGDMARCGRSVTGPQRDLT
jgi:hypothetical protein